MKIGVGGCSHSFHGWGNPWHYYMGKKLNSEIISSSSRGGGNEMNLEKIKFILDNHKIDFFVYQVTEPSRLVVGNNNWDPGEGLHNPTFFNEVSYQTFNCAKDTSEKSEIEKFFKSTLVPSKYNTDYKIFHTMMSMNQLCDFYGVKIYFFSWFVDLHEMAKESNYTGIISKLNVVRGYVNDFVTKNKISPISGDCHFDSDGHRIIYEQFIHPQLQDLIYKQKKLF
jgi:hypothetical protein